MRFSEYKKIVFDQDKEVKELYFDKDNEFKFQVAHLITEARIHSGLTQEQLAKKLKTQQPSIARIERGSALPSLSFLQKIAKALDTYLIAPRFGFMNDRVQNVSLNFDIPSASLNKTYVVKAGYFTSKESPTMMTSFEGDRCVA